MVPERARRRILVAMDAASHSPPCIECVADLAARLQAELVGLFVEDDDLLRWAALPGARRVSFLTGAAEAVDLAVAERELRTLAAALQRQLAEAADRRRVKWSLQVVRGRVAQEVARAAAGVDVLVVPCSSRPLMTYVRLRSEARGAAERVRASVLVLPAGARLTGPVLVPYDGSPAADQALGLAARLAGEGGAVVQVLLCATPAMPVAELEQRARARVVGAAALQCMPVPATGPALHDVVRRAPGGLLVLGEGCLPALAEWLRDAAEPLGLAVLTVRP